MVRIGDFTYDPTQLLGEGGFGRVYAGKHVELGVPVAVKVLAHDADPRELRALAALDHPRIARLLDADRLPSGDVVAVMERVHGAPVGRGTELPWTTVVLQILDALAHAHARGVVHGDLSPANVLVGPDGVRLIDLGLSTFVRDRPDEARRVAGTAGYTAPEQRAGRWRDVGPWTDLFAVGALAYALLTGAAPAVPPEPADPALDQWFARMLATSPEARFRRAADAARHLATVGLQASVIPMAPTLTATIELESSALPMDADTPLIQRVPCPADWRAPELRTPALALLDILGAKVGRDSAMLGREAERDALWAHLRAAHDERSGRVVVVHGPPGVGASRLARWLCERAHEVGVAEVLVGRAPDFIGSITEGHLPPGTRWQQAAEWIEVLTEGPRTVLLWLDDADEAALQLARSVPHALVVITANMPIEGVHAIGLGPLEPTALLELVRHTLALEPALAGQVEAHAGGNPGFAVQLVESWRPHLVPGPVGLRAAGELPFPQDIDALIAARLTDPAESLLVAAALGVVFPTAQLHALCGDDTPNALIPEAGGSRLRFRRPALRAALLAVIPHSIYARCAAALEPGATGELAGHVGWLWLQAGELDRAEPLLHARAEALSRLGEYRAALVVVDYQERALAHLPPEHPTWAFPAITRAECLQHLWRIDAAIASLGPVIARAREHAWPALPDLVRVLGAAHVYAGDQELGLECVGEAAALYAAIGNSVGEAHCAFIEGQTLLGLGDLRGAQRRTEVALDRFEEAQLDEMANISRAAIGALLLERGQYDEALAWLTKARALAPDNINQQLQIAVQVGRVHLERGHHTLARTELDRAVELAENMGSAMWIAVARLLLTTIAVWEGDGAEAELVELQAYFAPVDAEICGFAICMQAVLALRGGEPERAVALMEPLLTRVQPVIRAQSLSVSIAAHRQLDRGCAHLIERWRETVAFTDAHDRLQVEMLGDMARWRHDPGGSPV
jgi:tetratricopeptide (TPR) repeat protein